MNFTCFGMSEVGTRGRRRACSGCTSFPLIGSTSDAPNRALSSHRGRLPNLATAMLLPVTVGARPYRRRIRFNILEDRRHGNV